MSRVVTGLQGNPVTAHEISNSISKHLDTTINISDLTKKDLQKMIAEMRNSNLATNSIACYVRALRVFLSWAKAEGLCNVTIQSYKTEETVKETYSDTELTERSLAKVNATLPK